MIDVKKICAAGCCAVYILFIIFLPFLEVRGFTVSGLDIASFSGWFYLLIVVGVVMGICALALNGKISAIVSLAGAFVPLITFLLVRPRLLVSGMGLLNGFGSGSLNGYELKLASALIHAGLGIYLSMLAGFGSAVLCFLSELGRKPVSHDPGITTDPNDW